MLATNLPIMKQNLNKLLDVPPVEGPVYKAAYNAYYEANKAEAASYSSEDDPLGNQTVESAKIVADINSNIDKCADKFAKEFCKQLKQNGFMNAIADEIDGHVKAIKLMINIPALLPTIISPMGPCTGALSITEETGAQIQIL